LLLGCLPLVVGNGLVLSSVLFGSWGLLHRKNTVKIE
jgi:hypothetical protein